MSRDPSKPSDSEKAFALYRRIYIACHNETMRITDLIDTALYEAESDQVQMALANLAVKVFNP
jgi:hypothetical protein